MTRHTKEQFKECKKQIQTMGKSIDALHLNDSIDCLNFGRITNLRGIYQKIIPLINKYNGIIYGTTIGASIKNNKIAVRKTDDLDVRFKTEKDRTAFVQECMLKLGSKNYFVRYGFYGAVICRKSDKHTVVDTHVMEKNWNKKTTTGYKVTFNDSYVNLKTKDKKVKEYCNAKGESYSVSAQKKYDSVFNDINIGHSNDPLAHHRMRRMGKDALDVRLYNADAYIKAYDMWKKETDPKKKAKLNKIINELGRAILHFSSRKDILTSRQEAEKRYISDKMLDKRTFTSEPRLRKERAIYDKLGKNPDLDLTQFGTGWLEAVPIKRKKREYDLFGI